jgi:hypothetical protein
MSSSASLYEKKKQDDVDSTKGVFTEAQRKAVRKKLLGFANKSQQSNPTKETPKTQKKKKKAIPLLVEQEFHPSFNFNSYRPELDEISHLLLFRTEFLPYFRNKTSLTMDELRYKAEKCGMEGTMIEEKNNGYMLTGEMPRGGAIKQISFYLTKSFEKNNRGVVVKDIVFKTSV